MATIDSWQLVFDRAVDLIDSLLKSQPKSEVDALDIEEQIMSAVRQIAHGEVDPRQDWSVIIRPVNKKAMLDDKINEHYEIAIRQASFVRVLFEYHMKKIKESYSYGVKSSALMEVGEDMLSAFACAQQHATAWRLLSEVRDKSYEARSQKAARSKIDKKEDAEALLRALIESYLAKLRPIGGWRSHYIAAQDIAVKIVADSDYLGLPISSDQDKLSEKVQLMIWQEPRLRKAYNENAKEPLSEPVKMRKTFVKLGFGDGD